MKKAFPILLMAGILLLGPIAAPGRAAPWSGVDETVIEAFAKKAGRPAQEPLINTDQGDLLLFVFLLAGAAGGFAAGYWFRILFPPAGKGSVQAGSGDVPMDDGPGENGRAGVPNHDV